MYDLLYQRVIYINPGSVHENLFQIHVLAILALIHLTTQTKLFISQTIFISAIMNVDFIPELNVNPRLYEGGPGPNPPKLYDREQK